MAFTKYKILIYSEDPDKLKDFYAEVLGFKQVEHLDYPDDYGYMMQISGEYQVWIGKHSEVKGKAKENFRHLFNLYPEEGVEYWYNKVKDNPQVTVVAKPFLAPFSKPGDEWWFATILDPEGNCWQFVGKK